MVFEDKFYIGYSNVNKSFCLSNAAILRIFEDVAYMHSEAVGDGMNDTPLRWYLRSYHVKVINRPPHGERITAKTWSRSVKGVSASREFELYSENGELAVVALSNWARINGQTLKPERIADSLTQQYGSEPERTNFGGAWTGKIKEPEEFFCEREFFVDRNFIDANDHMNNVFYLELVNNTLPAELFEKGESEEFEIIFKKAAAYGETLSCSIAERDGKHIAVIKNVQTNDVNAVVRF